MKIREKSKHWSTASAFQLILIPAHFEQMHIMVVLFLRPLAQKAHGIVNGFERRLLARRRRAERGPPPAL